MREEGAEGLIEALARNVRPVTPVASLRWQVAMVAALSLGLSFALVEGRGLRPPGLALVQGPTPFALVALGLTLAGIGLVTAALAYARPGREGTGRRALAASALGLLISVGSASLVLRASAGGGEALFGGVLEIPCVVLSIGLSLPAALLVTYLAASAAPLRPAATAFLAACGATAFGTFAAHLTCRTPGAWHVITSHAATPLLGGLLMARPVLRLLRSWTQPA